MIIRENSLRSPRYILALYLLFFASCSLFAQGQMPNGVSKGGDDRTGEYAAVENWWKAAPDHDDRWTWGQVSGVAVDSPDRIIVAIWGDRGKDRIQRPDGSYYREERPGGSNYLVVVDGNGNLIERWAQWDSILNKPHQVYISPYDPDRHIWVVERGGGRNVNMQILKFTNDGEELVMQLVDPNHPTTRQEARANPDPGPFTYGDPAVLAFSPDGGFYLGDGYWHSRIVKYDSEGNYLFEWGELGDGPGQFDLVHGLAIDKNRRVYVGDRSNNRLQIFTEDGKFIEEWPDISDPVGIYIDQNEAVWVVSGRLNRILKYNLDGELQYHWGTFGGTMGGFPGGLARPHQIDVDVDGNVFIASWEGGWVNKFVPRPDADSEKLVGQPLVLMK